MKPARPLIAVAGLALSAYLVVDYGWKGVLRALQIVSRAGIAGITLFHALPTLLCGLAWWILLRSHTDANWFLYVWLRWIRDSTDVIVPILPLSEELVATRIPRLWRTAFAGAGIIVGLSGELIAQLLFGVPGTALLLALHPVPRYQVRIASGIGVMAVQFGRFLYRAKEGLFRIIERPFDWVRRRRYVSGRHGRIRSLLTARNSQPSSFAEPTGLEKM